MPEAGFAEKNSQVKTKGRGKHKDFPKMAFRSTSFEATAAECENALKISSEFVSCMEALLKKSR